MRARYYSPELRRFINADIIHGEISNPTSLNRYSYVNGNPVSFVDPFGLSKERGNYNAPSDYAPHVAPNGKTWQQLGFVYDGSIRDFKRLEQGLPPYAFEKWLKSYLYYSKSYYSSSGYIGNDIASASGGVYLGKIYAGTIESGLGVGAGLFGLGIELAFIF